MNTDDMIREEYRNTSIWVSQCQQAYLTALDTYGADDPRTQTCWAAYLKADQVAIPALVAMSQLMMRETREVMTDEEWSAIVD
jgi:hypothetical protein